MQWIFGNIAKGPQQSDAGKPDVTFRQDCRKVHITLLVRETAHRRYIRRL